VPVTEPLTFTNQFPGYPGNTLPSALLSEWEDTSWGNDTSPSFKKGNFLVWADWPNDCDRESPGGHRFILMPLDDEGCLPLETDTLLETDDFAQEEAFIQAH